MNHKVTLLEDDDYDLSDDAPAEIDFTQTKIDWERTRRFRAQTQARLIRLAPDVAEVFDSSEAVNEALRTMIRVMKTAAAESKVA